MAMKYDRNKIKNSIKYGFINNRRALNWVYAYVTGKRSWKSSGYSQVLLRVRMNTLITVTSRVEATGIGWFRQLHFANIFIQNIVQTGLFYSTFNVL